MNRIEDFILDHPGWLCFIVIAAFVSLIYWDVTETAKERQLFMAACQHDRKPYECEALWRGMQPQTVVVPMPMIIPSGR